MNQLPEWLVEKVEELMRGVSRDALLRAVAKLTANYKQASVQPLGSKEEHLAYLACRLPATYAVNCEVFKILLKYIQPASFLDVGAGPGTSLLALDRVVHKATLIERDDAFVAIAKKLLPDDISTTFLKMQANLGLQEATVHDVTACSYMLSELPKESLIPTLELLWNKTGQAVVLIETGTPKGYETLMQARSWLINEGGFLLAPCPHHATCPMPEGKWCHFPARLSRSKIHRELKGATLGYEDEKYSYLIVTKKPLVATARPRVVGVPCKRSGHVHLELCMPSGLLEKRTVSRKSGEEYTRAKNISWGEAL